MEKNAENLCLSRFPAFVLSNGFIISKRILLRKEHNPQSMVYVVRSEKQETK